MSDGLAFISMVAGFGLVIAAGAKIGAGSHTALSGLFATHDARDWPTGVQEADAPRFLLAGPPPPPPEIEELYAGPLRSRS